MGGRGRRGRKDRTAKPHPLLRLGLRVETRVERGRKGGSEGGNGRGDREVGRERERVAMVGNGIGGGKVDEECESGKGERVKRKEEKGLRTKGKKLVREEETMKREGHKQFSRSIEGVNGGLGRQEAKVRRTREFRGKKKVA